MSDEKTFPTRTPDLFAEDSPASPSPMPESREHRTTPATSGRKCLDLSGSVGPLGLLEKTLLDSSTWAWTKYSLTWKTKATPQGRLIFQLARLAPRTSDKDSGLLHTPTAKANQTDTGRGDLSLWPTPRAQEAKHGAATEWELQTDHAGTKDSLRVQVVKRMWPTPRKSMANGPTSKEVNSGETKGRLENAVQLWPTPSSRDGKGGYQGGRIRNGKISRDTLDVTVQYTDNQEKTGGQLNPKWVAWLMGYPTEYLSCVPWETQSSRKSRKK
jgi:hypothetical protein